MVKTGAMHLESLCDGRQVFLDGTIVQDLVNSPAYRNALLSAASLYDLQASSEYLETATFCSPSSGNQVNRCWQFPTSYEELLAKRQAMVLWADITCGMMGRSPDHVASCLTGMVMGIETFKQYPGGKAAALLDYFQYARDHDLFLSYVIANPQTNRLQSTLAPENEPVAAHICDEDGQGMTIRGAKMLGTSTILSNEILVGNIQPLKPEEESLAFTVALPLGTPGIKILSRRSYEAAATSIFDYPLSSRFDENDAVIYFDEVKVPWERVFVLRDVELSRAQFHETPAQLLMGYQSIVRLMVKMRFLLGIARKMSELNGLLTLPQVQEKLGYLAAQTTMVQGMVQGMEIRGTTVGQYYLPDRRMLHSAQVLTQELYPHFVTAMRELAGGGVIMLPSSSRDFAHAELTTLIKRTQQSPQAEAMERVKTMKLAWDALGSEFGSRHVQYEMFYAGASYVTRGNAFRSFDWQSVVQVVDRLLGTYNADSATPLPPKNPSFIA
jgi:4-hydroxyphenylacetate 3-monooxygenase